MPERTRIGSLKIVDPDQWEAEIRHAMKVADGRIPDAAEALLVSKRQLYRWLSLPEFKDVERAPFRVKRGCVSHKKKVSKIRSRSELRTS